MNTDKESSDPPDLAAENAELRARLAEAEETLEAIRTGGVDALVTSGPDGDQIFTLESAETPYRLLMESMNEGAAMVAADGTILYCNHRFAKMAGRPAEQVVGRGLGDCVARAQQPIVQALVASALQAGARIELPFTSPEGRELPVLLSLRPIHRDSGAIAVVATDLTERHQHEATLRQLNEGLEARVHDRTAELVASEHRYRLLFDRNPDGVFTLDTSGHFLMANPACEEISGYSVNELLQKNFQELCAPDQLANTADYFRRCLEENKMLQHETAVLRKDGQRVELWVAGEPVKVDQQLVVHCSVKDITALRAAQEQIRESEERLRLLGDNLPNSTVYQYTLKPDGTPRFVYVSAGVERLNGVKAQDVLQDAGVLHRQILHEDMARMLEAERVSARGLSVFEQEVRMRLPDGQVRWMYLRSRPRLQPDGKVIWDGVQTDITERKQAEQDLFAANQRLQAVMEAVPVGVSYSNDATCQHITGNSAVLAQFEVTPADNLSASARDASAPGRQVRFFHNGQPVTDAQLPLQRAVAENRVIPPLELEVVLPSGRCWFTEASGAPVRDQRGEVLGGVAVTVDITERKQAQETLQRHAEQLQASNEELDRFNQAMVGRELRMIELKQEVDALCALLGEPPRYPPTFGHESGRLTP